MTDEEIEMEARGVFALMDGVQLQWLLNPSLPVADIFRRQLDLILERWARGAKTRRRRVPSGITAPVAPMAEKAEETGASAGLA